MYQRDDLLFIVLESTGHYHTPIVQYFEDRGYLLIHELDSYQKIVVVVQLSLVNVNAAENYSKLSGNLILNPVRVVKEYLILSSIFFF